MHEPVKLTFSFVPTPSVPDTRIGFLYPAAEASKRPPNPPMPPRSPERLVDATIGLILETSESPASISTPLLL